MPITLAQAAVMTGMARSSILRAIKRGAISGTRTDDGNWLVDPAELQRGFPVNGQATPQAAHADPVAAVRLEAAQQRIADLERALSDMRGERDEWRGQAQSVTRQLEAPKPPDATPAPQDAQPEPERSRLLRAWRWMQKTA